MRPTRHHFAFLLTGLLCAGSARALPPDGGKVFNRDDATDQTSDALDRRLVDEVSRNLASLKQRGITPAGSIQAVGSPRPPGSPQAVNGMTWPLGPVNGAGTAWHGISNFVDLNPGFPGQVTDYTCAARSYDTAAGYNHRGIDYFIWPFGWTLMDSGAVDVLAVAPGTLVAKGDGNNDRSCSFDAPDTPNYAVVMHADGSVARYLHMKNGSVTSLPIGAPVPAGTPLGKVGSSGISTGPHLHLELRASNTAGAAVIEPHTGACNVSTTMQWAQERPYRQPRVNRLSTHGAAPQLASCPGTVDQPNFKDQFVPGDPIIFTAAYRDQGSGQASSYRVLRPDGSTFASWNHSQNSGASYNAAYWYWSNLLPANAPTGLWTFETVYEGLTSRHSFQVADGTPDAPAAFPVELSGSWYNTSTSGQGFNLDMVGENRFLLYFYGYDNQGDQLWLYGDFNPGAPAFAYNSPVELDMYVLEGGGFQSFAPPSNRVWGTARLLFESCKRASIVLTGESGTQVLQLDKLNTTRGLSCP